MPVILTTKCFRNKAKWHSSTMTSGSMHNTNALHWHSALGWFSIGIVFGGMNEVQVRTACIALTVSHKPSVARIKSLCSGTRSNE